MVRRERYVLIKKLVDTTEKRKTLLALAACYGVLSITCDLVMLMYYTAKLIVGIV